MEALARLCDWFCGLFFVMQAALSDCRFLAPFPFSQNGFVMAEVDVGECYVFQALVVAVVV